MSITVTGGAGGAEAVAEQLEDAARTVVAASAEVEGALDRVRALDRLVDGAAADSPGTTWAASYAVEPLHLGTIGLPARLHALADLGDRLRVTAAGHRAAEARAREAVAAAVRASSVLGSMAGEAGPVPVGLALLAFGRGAGLLTLGRALRGLSPAGQALIAAGGRVTGVGGPAGWVLRAVTGPGAVPEGAGLIPAADLRRNVMPFVGSWITTVRPGPQDVPTRPVAEAAAGLARLNAWIGRATGRDRSGVEIAVHATEAGVAIPPDAAGCLELVRADQPGHGGQDGQVSVRRIDFADGTTSWLVTVPGTQDWLPGTGSNPADLQSNLELVGRLHADALAGVSAAMIAAGVGNGDDVVIAGHSQGGIVAADLVTSLAAAGFAGRVMAVTAGSPVGAVLPKRMTPGADVLAYGHTHDPVTGLQAGDNPTGPHVTTVERDLGAEGPGGNRDVAAQHDLGTYVETARAASESGDVSVAAAEARLAELLGEGREVATTSREVYVVTRPEA